MGNAVAQGQKANILPPVEGRIIALTLDATSRRYDLGALAIGGAGVDFGGELFLVFCANVRCYFKFNSTNAGTADETAADAAGAAPTFQANACFELPPDQPIRMKLNRKDHRFLILKGSGAGIFRLWASSEPAGR